MYKSLFPAHSPSAALVPRGQTSHAERNFYMALLMDKVN